jgi:hypothetical protein
MFEIVLNLLRSIDASGSWPQTSIGRQKVLNMNTLVECGGRGGSFSVGCLPKHLAQPKGNYLFPGFIIFFFQNFIFISFKK